MFVCFSQNLDSDSDDSNTIKEDESDQNQDIEDVEDDDDEEDDDDDDDESKAIAKYIEVLARLEENKYNYNDYTSLIETAQ